MQAGDGEPLRLKLHQLAYGDRKAGAPIDSWMRSPVTESDYSVCRYRIGRFCQVHRQHYVLRIVPKFKLQF